MFSNHKIPKTYSKRINVVLPELHFCKPFLKRVIFDVWIHVGSDEKYMQRIPVWPLHMGNTLVWRPNSVCYASIKTEIWPKTGVDPSFPTKFDLVLHVIICAHIYHTNKYVWPWDTYNISMKVNNLSQRWQVESILYYAKISIFVELNQELNFIIVVLCTSIQPV